MCEKVLGPVERQKGGGAAWLSKVTGDLKEGQGPTHDGAVRSV